MQRSGITHIALVLLGLIGISAGEPISPGSKPDEGLTQITLPDAAGKSHRPFAEQNQKATVLVFLMHDCPVTNKTSPELARLSSEFAPKGIRFFGIYVTETAAEIATHLKDYGLPFPGLLDPQLKLARLSRATRVPEAAVYSPAGELLYRGRIDDRAVQPGTTRAVPTRRDLHLALEAVVAGRAPDPKLTKAVGCYLPTSP